MKVTKGRSIPATDGLLVCHANAQGGEADSAPPRIFAILHAILDNDIAYRFLRLGELYPVV